MKINYDKCLFLDIETSTVTADNDDKIQVVYLTNVLLVDTVNKKIISSKFFRTMYDTINYLDLLNEREHLICYCHNLDYELYHILRELEGNGVVGDKKDIYNKPLPGSIFRDTHQPLSIYLQELPNINFRDSYALFNKGVARLGQEVDLPKLEYDYKVTRTPHTELTQLDYDYNERDNVIVMLSMFKRWEERGETLKTTPLTFTASTKKDRYNFIKNNFGSGAIKSLNVDKFEQEENIELYDLFTKAFQGGLTTANQNIFNVLLKDKVVSIDITSSYPYQLCTRYFPYYKKGYTKCLTGEDSNIYFQCLKNIPFWKLPSERRIKGYVAKLNFIDVEIKNKNFLLPLASSNVIDIQGGEYINGKILKCKKLSIVLDNVAVTWFNLCYNYTAVQCSKIFTTTKDRYLRLGEVSFLLNNFRIKQSLKNVEGKELEYNLAKVNCNNNYGVKVQKTIKDRYDIEEGKITKIEFNKMLLEEQEEIYNRHLELEKSKYNKYQDKNFDIFSDGVYVTSYAKYMLIDMMVKITNSGNTVVYSDTDSLKFICDNMKNFKELLVSENKKIKEGNKDHVRFKEYIHLFDLTKKDLNIIADLGTWDIENDIVKGKIIPYKFFKTLGAKKYLTYSDKKGLITTIAGCSKNVNKVFYKYVEHYKCDMEKAINDLFRIGVQFDSSASGRTVATRDNRPLMYCRRLTHNNLPLFSSGGIIIENTSYTLGITKNDMAMLNIGYDVEGLLPNTKVEYIYKVNKDGIIYDEIL